MRSMRNSNGRNYTMTPDPEIEYIDEEEQEQPEYPSMSDIPNPEHMAGPVGPSLPAYDADMLNFLQQSVSDSFYPAFDAALKRATEEIVSTDQLGGLYPAITRKGAARLRLLANKYIQPSEYVVTNIDNRQFRSIQNDFRMDAALAGVGRRKLDYNNTFTSLVSMIGNHLTGAKLTRSLNGFERTTQQTQRAELSSTYEHKHPAPPPSGIARALGRR